MALEFTRMCVLATSIEIFEREEVVRNPGPDSLKSMPTKLKGAAFRCPFCFTPVWSGCLF